MKVGPYDLAFCLGVSCAATQLLRTARRQFVSFPLDWAGLNGIRVRADLIGDGFRDFLLKENLECRGSAPRAVNDWYVDRSNGLVCPHDFKKDLPLSETYPAVRAKYDRRIVRFDELMSKARNVFVLWLGDGRFKERISDDDIAYAREAIARRYPQAKLMFMVIDYHVGVARKDAEHREGPDFEYWGFDFRNYEQGTDDWVVRQDMLLPFVAGINVRDYRTREEKRKYRRLQQEKLRWRLNAEGVWDFFWARLQFGLYKRLRRRLEHRGARLEA